MNLIYLSTFLRKSITGYLFALELLIEIRDLILPDPL